MPKHSKKLSNDHPIKKDMGQKKGETTASGLNDQRKATASQKQLISDLQDSPQSQKLTQLKAMLDESPHIATQRQKNAELFGNTVQQKTKSKNKGLPENLKANMETLSGTDLSDVKIHYNSSKPAQLSAHAYAEGNNIHIAPGQKKHLAHEAWHTVQQKQGRVKPTVQTKGARFNDDKGLEKEADKMGTKATQMKKATGNFAKSSSSGNKSNAQLTKNETAAIQRRITIGEDERSLIYLAVHLQALKGWDYDLTLEALSYFDNQEFESMEDLISWVEVEVERLEEERAKEYRKFVGNLRLRSAARKHLNDGHLSQPAEEYLWEYRHEIDWHTLNTRQSIKIGDGRLQKNALYGQILFKVRQGIRGRYLEVYHAHDNGRMG